SASINHLTLENMEARLESETLTSRVTTYNIQGAYSPIQFMGITASIFRGVNQGGYLLDRTSIPNPEWPEIPELEPIFESEMRYADIGAGGYYPFYTNSRGHQFIVDCYAG